MSDLRTILVVDDEPDMLMLLKRSLEPDLGCRVVTARSGTDALRCIAETRVDLVLADIRMPGMDGLTMLELIRRRHPELTVVMMTGHGSADTAARAMRSGACDVIAKPFDHEILLRRLKRALARSEKRSGTHRAGGGSRL